MTDQLHDFYVKGSDGVVYRAIYALDNDFYLVCNTNVDVTDMPVPVYVIRGEKVEDFNA
ncbi:MAG: hypothetical protein WC444_06395 [Candidatus Paceibacterota bacterium]